MDTASAHPGTRLARRTRRTATFPFAALPIGPGWVPVEVSLVARLGHGAGDKLYHEAALRQGRHGRFVNALDEPSAKLGNTDLARGDATALYSFGVGHRGHPFHRHAGHRVFTAVAGSGGALLRFSSATPAELERDPGSFLRAMHVVSVPPDCLFTVRFSGDTWHQFVSQDARGRHPAFFALSTHTNELGGDLSDALRQRVLAGEADIPSLTELLPETVVRHLASAPRALAGAPVTALSLHDRPGGLLEAACRRVRSLAGRLQRWRIERGVRPGYVSEVATTQVTEGTALAADSLLRDALPDRVVHHQDRFALALAGHDVAGVDAAAWLAAVLDGFLANRPRGVARMMAWRNALVRPLGLRTSPLGCPVSSLLSTTASRRFAGRFPVHDFDVSADGRRAQVLLGADDKHLVFRSCVAVRRLDDGGVEFELSNRIACNNRFGRFYVAAIDWPHRRFVAPTLLMHAVDAAVVALRAQR
ncbi:MAG TPA: DUF2867 domain-containing protein [Burkholderiaceae bacterium]